jgi:hypothetical protein
MWGNPVHTIIPMAAGSTGVIAPLVEPTALTTDERMGVPNEHQSAEHLLFACHLFDSASNVLNVFVDTRHTDCLALYHSLNLTHTLREVYEFLCVLLNIRHHHRHCPDDCSCLCDKAEQKSCGDTSGYVPTFIFVHRRLYRC